MPTRRLIEQLRRTVLLPNGAGLSDGQLLECFTSQRDDAAFAALVHRHGPMVWSVCRRVLHDHHDAEDAFQATFLVLIRKAASVVPGDKVANWLFGVACQTAQRVRVATAKRKAREKVVAEVPEAAAEQDPGRDLRSLLDQELRRLPDKYRTPIVLCDLEGKTGKEAARQLGWPEGTVAGRLARGRDMLAKRLARQGLALSSGALAAALLENAASGGVPASLLAATTKVTATATGAISAEVVALTEGVIQAMFLKKLKLVALVLLTGVCLCAGPAVLTYTSRAEQKTGPSAAPPSREGQLEERKNTDKVQALPDKIRALRQERVDALKKAIGLLEEQLKSGQRLGPDETWIRAKKQLTQAELELCQSDEERIKVLERAMAYTKVIERVNKVRADAGVKGYSSIDVHMAQADRIEAEIALEQVKAKIAARSK